MIATLMTIIAATTLLQAISRSGFAWYELQYGYDFEVSNCTGDEACYAALIYSVIITPTVSFGYLALFLKIEPHAYTKFRELFCLGPSSRSRHESKDTIGKIGASDNGSSNGSRTSYRESAPHIITTTNPASTRSGTSGGSQLASEETSSSAYIARESSLYYHQQAAQSSSGWAGSSLWKGELEAVDERDEAELLESIDSECQIGPPSFSQPSTVYDADTQRASLGTSYKSNSSTLSFSKSKSAMNMQLQSSTNSPLASVSNVKDMECQQDSGL